MERPSILAESLVREDSLDQDQSTDAIGFRCAMDRIELQCRAKENQRIGADYNKKDNNHQKII